LLRQWHGRVYHDGKILPFWYAIPWDIRDPGALASDIVASLSLQALAFWRRDPLLLTRTLSSGQLAEGLRSTRGPGGILLAEALAWVEGPARSPFSLARAALVPHRLAAITGTRVLCLVDDVGNLAAAQPGFSWPEEATASPIAPAIFTLDDESLLPPVFGPDAAALVTIDRLGPLSAEAATRLARHLAQSAGLELSEQALASLARESAGSPFYLGALVRALVERAGTGMREVAQASAAALCEGELARFWMNRLTGAIPDRRTRATALEILAFCMREGEESPDAGRLAGLMLKPEADVESALAGLARAGVVRVDCTLVTVDDDPVLRDVVQALYRREFGRVSPPAVFAALAAVKVRGAPAIRQRLWRESLRGAVLRLVSAWDGQSVPSILFDAGAFSTRYGGQGVEDVIAAVAGETDTIALPHVISAVAGHVGSGRALPGIELDALAWAQSSEAKTPEADVAWVARFLLGGAGGVEEIEQFDRDTTALQSAGELPAERLVRWALLEAPLDANGQAAASRHRLLTSTRQQIEALARLVGVAVSLPPRGPAPSAGPELELEMVIPRVADVELVAARALEQLAENLAIAAPVIGKLKVALVEACINAFEHGGARDGRVRVLFTAGGGRLEIRVENRGRPLAALPAPASPGRESRGRGWGLTLIRELVDEVSLEPREDGVCLLMVTYLGRGEDG
jgi:serine/threonine-protein kinase RsbW